MKNKKGFTLIELLVVIGILGLLMSAMFPAIQAAMLSSRLTEALQNGKKLHQEIFNLGLENHVSCWPRTSVDDPGEEVYEKAYQSSREYFEALFDAENLGTANWKPKIDRDTFKCLGCGDVQAPSAGAGGSSSGSLKEDNIAWTVAANISTDCPAPVPVLVTRNVPGTKLLKTYDNGKKDQKIEFGSEGGAQYEQPFGSKGAVMIYIDGQGRKLTGTHTYKKIYDYPFNKIPKLSSTSGEFTYLAPNGPEAPQ